MLLSLRSTPFGKHSLSPYETVTGRLMHLDEGAYEPALLKGDIPHACQGLTNQLEENYKLMTDSFHTVLPRDKDFKYHGLQ